MSIRFVLDRSLPVPLGVQLRGLVEYGIACGQLAAGERLPSVREMAAALGIAPMTVAAVYRELAAAQLIAARPGSGTFVTGEAPRADPGPLDAALDHVIAAAKAAGLTRDALLARLHARLQTRPQPAPRALNLLFVGVFAEASRAYAAAIAPALPDGDRIAAETIDRLRQDPAQLALARRADLVLTIANRRAEVAALLPDTPVVAIAFLPSEATRLALAGLDPLAHVVAVSVFPEFLATMTHSVRHHAAHVSALAATVLDAPDLAATLAAADAVVFATGAEAILAQLPPSARAIEYRHTPDPRDVARLVLPRLEALRTPLTEVAA